MRSSSNGRTQALHQVAAWYERNGFRIRVNDGELCSFVLDFQGRSIQPQLVVWEGQLLVRFVEVETEDSLDDLAPRRWRRSLDAGVPLHVYVPTSSLEKAWHLRTEADAMGAHLLTYDTETNTARHFLPRTHERA